MVITMNLVWTILLALFPYLHAQRYGVSYVSCEPQRIIVEDSKERFEITLFNLKIHEEAGWEKVCHMMENAEVLELEIDPSAQVSEPLPVYLFADGELIQKTLVRENHAYTLIHNPEYLYEEELLALEESTTTMAIKEAVNETNSGQSNGWLFLLFIFASWVITILLAIVDYKQKHSTIHKPS